MPSNLAGLLRCRTIQKSPYSLSVVELAPAYARKECVPLTRCEAKDGAAGALRVPDGAGASGRRATSTQLVWVPLWLDLCQVALVRSMAVAGSPLLVVVGHHLQDIRGGGWV